MIGFRWKNTVDKRQFLMEEPNIVQWRYRYLRFMKKYRDDNRNIIYLDETWINNNLSFGKCTQLEKIDGFKKHTAGQRLIVVHAGNGNGFVGGGRQFRVQVWHRIVRLSWSDELRQLFQVGRRKTSP
ncbi:hypothetical protein JTE90_025715 [Oedothorax gibbosus]|uniref:Tc1-like transposase DDE domain-containing protein n=1 Tax=Oedothorax gibbosus TaxID=931172 RepID=A0AAV6UHI3_9ARAC|nr:hypothetical protein JTE90_025715 [Oedothorax gibbosus]